MRNNAPTVLSAVPKRAIVVLVGSFLLVQRCSTRRLVFLQLHGVYVRSREKKGLVLVGSLRCGSVGGLMGDELRECLALGWDLFGIVTFTSTER